jgi:glycosyltransferase involved in cell wall biosynthesis
MAFRGEREVSLRIGGSGESEASLRRLAAQLQIEHRVEFLGALERDRLVKELGDCDAFVLASRLETFGVAVIEALALGRAVIATRCGGPEYIVRKEDGILVDAEDVEGLASALRQMSEQASRYDPEALRRGVVERFGPETVARQIIDVYRDLLGGNG